MSEGSSTRTRRAVKEGQVPSSEVPSVAPAVVETPTRLPSPEELRLKEELGNLLTELVFDAQDVGFELALLKCDRRNECPLVKKTISLVQKVRDLFELQRKLTKKGIRP